MAMDVSYGGGYDNESLDALGRTAFVFRVHQILQFSERPLYSQDNTDTEVVHVRLQVGFIVTGAFGANPVAAAGGNPLGGVGIQTANFSQANPPNPNVAGAADLTDKVIQMLEVLRTPRLPLRIAINGQLYLQVPQGLAGGAQGNPAPGLLGGAQQTYRTDCRQGPLPISTVLTRWMGTKSAYCVWEVETFVQKTLGYNNTSPADQPLVLSHRWEETQVFDTDYLTERTISGRVVFANNAMIRQVYAPDDFRQYLMRSIPPNTRRENLRMRLLSDGCSCDYSYVDQVPPENTGSGTQVLHFECHITKEFSNPNSMMTLIPLFHYNVDLTVRGYPTTSRQTLMRVCMNAVSQLGFKRDAADRFGQLANAVGINGQFPGSTPGFRYQIRMNYARRECSISAGFKAGSDIISDAVQFFPGGIAGQINLSFGENIQGVTAPIQGFNNYSDNPPPRLSAGARADSYFGRMLVQVPNNTLGDGGVEEPPELVPLLLADVDPLDPRVEQVN